MARKSAKSEQFGRRAADGYSQVNANIPIELKRRFKAKLALEDRTMQEVIEELLRKYVEG